MSVWSPTDCVRIVGMRMIVPVGAAEACCAEGGKSSEPEVFGQGRRKSPSMSFITSAAGPACQVQAGHPHGEPHGEVEDEVAE
eukprot:9475303-Pyramimonas_sp.AAC.1